MLIFAEIQTVFLQIYYLYEDKDGMVLQGMRKRESEMDGQVSCLRGVEYHGGGDCGDGKEAGRCSSSISAWIRP